MVHGMQSGSPESAPGAGNEPASAILAEYDAMIARAEAACERLERAASMPKQHKLARRHLVLSRQKMEAVLDRLRKERERHLRKLVALTANS